MRCVKCKKQATIFLPNLNACGSCFIKIIERRVRKEIRINELITKNDRVLVIDDGSADAHLSLFLLREIIKDPTVSISVKKSKYILGDEAKGNFDKVIIPWNADREAEYFFSSVLGGKKARWLGHYKIKKKAYLKILLHVLQQEAELFCRLKKMEYSKIKNQKQAYSGIIDNLEKEYPEIKFSLIKSSEQIKKVFK